MFESLCNFFIGLFGGYTKDQYNAACETRDAQIKELEQALTREEDTSNSYKDQLEEAEKEVEDLKNQIDNFEYPDISEYEEKIKELESQIAEKDNSISDLTGKVNESENKNEQYEKELSACKSKSEELTNENNSLKSEVEDLNNQLEEAKEYIKDLTTRIDALQTQLNELINSSGTATITIPESDMNTKQDTIKLYKTADECPVPRISISTEDGAIWYAKLGDIGDNFTGITYKNSDGKEYAILNDSGVEENPENEV